MKFSLQPLKKSGKAFYLTTGKTFFNKIQIVFRLILKLNLKIQKKKNTKKKPKQVEITQELEKE